ncbi:DinB family protein [Rubrivirga sp. S365]|nr:DinB family protein [Rubrivirga sp. S365]MDT7855735.1 DinB family protein [Rubrivirga sp. S365]
MQPVAHALVQAREEVPEYVADVGGAALWARPAGRASVGFHLQHLAGVLDRLLTYARGEALSDAQLAALDSEGEPRPALTTGALVAAFEDAVDRALAQIRATDPATLLDARAVGRDRIPSTALGLLVHAAEHTQRHVGQLLVTAAVVTTPPA